jgi:hypothetical protein
VIIQSKEIPPMKLVRYYRENEIRPGIWIQDEPEAPTILDVRSLAFDIADYNATFFQRWGPQRLQGLVSENKLSAIPANEVRLAAPVAPPGKIICLGKIPFSSAKPHRPSSDHRMILKFLRPRP